MKLCFAIFFFCVNCTFAAVTETVDKFTQERTYRTDSAISADGAMHASAFLGLKKGGAQEFGVLISSTNKGWRYLTCNSMHWLIDDKPYVMPTFFHRGDVLKGGYVMEIMGGSDLPISVLSNLGAAKKIEYKICNDEYAFSQKEISDFHELSTKLAVANP